MAVPHYTVTTFYGDVIVEDSKQTIRLTPEESDRLGFSLFDNEKTSDGNVVFQARTLHHDLVKLIIPAEGAQPLQLALFLGSNRARTELTYKSH